jgi:protease PrsW
MPLLLLILVFIAIAIGLAWFMIVQDKGQKEPVIALWVALIFGFIGALTAGYLEGHLINGENLLPGTPHGSLLIAAMSVGVIEEACKFVPLAIFLYRKRYFNEHTDGVMYFALAGLGFGLPENILYTIQYGSKTAAMRLFLTPLFHAAITGMIGYYLAKRKLAGKPVLGISLALGAAMILHGLYDFGLIAGTPIYSGMALVITLCLSGGLFLLFARARGHDQDSGLSIVGHNAFCRSCGSANPQHHLYCIQCGKNA